VNNGEWVNFYIGGQPCIRMNICMRMNHAILKIPARGGTGKVSCYGQNPKFFWTYIVKNQHLISIIRRYTINLHDKA